MLLPSLASIHRAMRVILYVGTITVLIGCASLNGCVHRIQINRETSPNPQRSETKDYIDIQPGWRLTVVTPILKSGGYVLKSREKETSGNVITLDTATDFVGYEVAHYKVTGHNGGLVRVALTSAEVTRDGKTEPQARSIAPLFRQGRRSNYLRLIYLVRISQVDHNMAVVEAREIEDLEALTRRVQANPIGGCTVDRNSSCSWVPEGIAVRPEVLKIADGIEKWIDAPR
jgi:hypothetical protein